MVWYTAEDGNRPFTRFAPRRPGRLLGRIRCTGYYLVAIGVKGRWYYLYLVEDIFSRKIGGHEVHKEESGEWAASLMERMVLSERCYRQPLVLHADNGAAMKSQTLNVKLAELKITPSHSRPRVSNDNAYVESLLRTVK